MVAPVNLNRFRKQKAKISDKARADENAARSGRSNPDKERQRAKADKSRRDLDGHELDP